MRKYQSDIYSFIAHRPDTPATASTWLLRLYHERKRRIRMNYNIFRVDLRSPKKLDKRQSSFMKKIILRNRAKHHFRMNERNLKTLLQYPRPRRGYFSSNFINYFEGRLDVMLIKHYFLETASQIRNSLLAGMILVNDFVIPRHRHFAIKMGDVVCFADKSIEPQMRAKIKARSMHDTICLPVPSRSEFSWSLLRSKLWASPAREGGGRIHFQLKLRTLYNFFASF